MTPLFNKLQPLQYIYTEKTIGTFSHTKIYTYNPQHCIIQWNVLYFIPLDIKHLFEEDYNFALSYHFIMVSNNQIKGGGKGGCVLFKQLNSQCWCRECWQAPLASTQRRIFHCFRHCRQLYMCHYSQSLEISKATSLLGSPGYVKIHFAKSAIRSQQVCFISSQ